MSRTGRHWTAPVSDTPTYINNRRSDWSYNSSGSVTSRDSGQRTHTYDATGKQRNFSEQGLQAFSGGHWVSHQYTIDQTYDGGGRAGKRVETRYSEDENGLLEDSTETTYQLRSSVLGGALMLEIDQWGNREGHVYAGGELLADYQYHPAPYTITTILHPNPTTGQWVENGVRTELDPLGADVSSVNPYLYNMTYSDIMGADNLYYRRGNALDIRGGCALYGMPMSCSEMHERVVGGIPTASEFGGLSRGLTINDPLRPLGPIDWIPDFLDWVDKRKHRLTLENYISLGWQWFREKLIGYQAPIDGPGIENTVLAALAVPGCVSFANTILGAQRRKGLGSLMDVAKSFFALPGPRLTRNPPAGSTMRVSNPIGRVARNNAQIYSLGNDDSLSPNKQMVDDTDSAISELFHLTAEGGHYTDEELARAVNSSTYASDAYRTMSNGRPLIDPRANIFDPRYMPNKKDKYDRENSFSRYFHTIQQLYCTSQPGAERQILY